MGGLKQIAIIIAVILGIVVFCASSFFLIIEGITGAVTDWISNSWSEVQDWADNFAYGVKKLFGVSTIKNGMMIYELSQENITTLKDTLEADAVATDESGLTEVTLRKMILANAVTSSTQDTLCAVEISDEEALQGTDYDNIDDYLESLTKKQSTDVWPIDDVNYKLYYITDSFFYFRDEDGKNGIMGTADEDDEGQLYLGIMGTISIINEEGLDLQYVDQTEFNNVKSRYEELSGTRDGTTEEDNLLSVYTRSEEGIIVYTIDKNEKEYNYKFKNSNMETIDENGYDEDSEYNVGTMALKMENEKDISDYAISIELLMDFLNFTGSPQYVDEFIDYALQNFEVNINAYSLTAESHTYEKNTYSIQDGYIYELYDIVDSLDIGKDNMTTYKPLIYDRTYQGRSFQTSVVKLSDFDSIDLGISNNDEKQELEALAQAAIGDDGKVNFETLNGNLPDGFTVSGNTYTNTNEDRSYTITENGKVKSASVGPISDYLKLAYDPSASFSLGDIIVEESITTHKKTRDWYFTISSINTWYGKITYGAPTRSNYYDINGVETTEEEYNNFDIDDITEDKYEYEGLDNEKKTSIFISNARAQEIGVGNDEENGIYVIGEFGQSDLYDNIFTTAVGEGNKSNFRGWTARGLGEIAATDGGKYNNKTGVGQGSDYLYSKYTETNRIKFKPVEKTMQEVIEESTNLPTYDSSKIDTFLSLWKNETGNIDDRNYSAAGKKVLYNDIYGGQTAVGDIFKSAPEMLFTVLESSDNTKNLVDIFKYIMHIYTGESYGVDSLEGMFNIVSVKSFYGNSIEEKVWFALKDLGFSDIAVAGVMGNINGESGFNPGEIEDGSGEGHGLCQWSYGRKDQLMNYANYKGTEWQDVDTQIEFLITEITGQGAAVGYATSQMDSEYNGYTKSNWENATTVKEATTAFCYVFERPGIPRLDSRISAAEEYLKNYQGKELPSLGNYTGTEGEKVCQAAKTIREYCNSHGYSYNVSVPDYSEGVRALWNKKGVCCASYVAWTLVESGVVSEDYINSLSFRGATQLGNGLKKIFPTVSKENMQAGDIIFWPGHHTQIYAGDGYWYNAGTSPIKYSSYDAITYFRNNNGWTSYYILRPVQQ